MSRFSHRPQTPDHHDSARFPGAPTLLFTALLSAGFAMAAPQAVDAETTTPAGFTIASGPLTKVLNQFASSAGIALQYNPELTAGKQSSGLNGAYSVSAAFQHLLAGTGLVAVPSQGNTYVIRAESDDNNLTLPTLEIDSNRMHSNSLGDITEGTGSYTTGAMATATRLGLSARETPQSVSVVTQQQLEDTGAQSIEDVMKQVTGVSALTYDSARSGYAARGFDIENIQIDGTPSTFASTWAAGNSAGQDQTNPVLYDRIEVVRGANALTEGTGNPSASVNMVRKRATSKEFTGYVSEEMGRWDHYRETVDLSTPLNEDGSVRGRIVGSYMRENSYQDLLGDRERDFLATLSADLDDQTQFNIGATYQGNDPDGSTWGGSPVALTNGGEIRWPRSKTTGADWTTWQSKRQSVYASLDHEFDNGASVHANIDHSRSGGLTKLLYLSGVMDPSDGSGITAYPYWADTDIRQNTMDLHANLPFSFNGLDSEAVVGATYAHQNLKTWGRTAPATSNIANYYDWWNGSYPEPEWGDKSLTTETDLRQRAFYAATRLQMTEQLKLILGSRVTDWQSKGVSSGVAQDYKHSGVVTPYAGIVYDINDTYSAYASYTEIFKPQSYRDQQGHLLDPLEGKNYEAGIKADYLDGRVNASFSVYRIEQDNLAQADGGTVLDTTEYSYTMADDTVSRGYEMELRGAITDNWNLFLGWSQYVIEDGDGLAVNTGYANRTAKLFTTYNRDNWTVGGGFNWQSKIRTGGHAANGVEQDPYAVFNLMARYEFSPQLSAQFNIDNLFDKEYYSSVQTAGTAIYGEPRNARMTLKYQF